MKAAYIDCFSGVAGDMLLAALLDAVRNLLTAASSGTSVPAYETGLTFSCGRTFWYHCCEIEGYSSTSLPVEFAETRECESTSTTTIQ